MKSRVNCLQLSAIVHMSLKGSFAGCYFPREDGTVGASIKAVAPSFHHFQSNVKWGMVEIDVTNTASKTCIIKSPNIFSLCDQYV